MAQPGEFTIRAFLAGRMDLAQAEAVADLIASDSRASHAMASTQMRGGYSAALGALRDELLQLASLLELELDFSEEDVQFADRARLREMMHRIESEITRLTDSFRLGNTIKKGVVVAIVGEPNVGKSTLLNRLLGEERALVSDIAGTTRDTIEETLNIDGVLFRFIDTAGLHDTADRLEQMGIDRTQEMIRRAQIVLQVVDATCPIPPAIQITSEQTRLLIVNKCDSPDARITESKVSSGCGIEYRVSSANPDTLFISAKTGEGIERLLARLRATFDTGSIYDGDPVISNSRHLEALRQALDALHRALTALDDDRSADLLSEDIRQVIHHLGTITGEITNDDILSQIFSKFCIGK